MASTTTFKQLKEAGVCLVDGSIDMDCLNKSWRQWVLKNHPDKGGNVKRFQETLTQMDKARKYLEDHRIYQHNNHAQNIKSNTTPTAPPTYNANTNVEEFLASYKRWFRMQSKTNAPPRPASPNTEVPKPKTTRMTPLTEGMYLNTSTKRYVKEGSSAYKRYLSNGWKADPIKKQLSPPSK